MKFALLTVAAVGLAWFFIRQSSNQDRIDMKDAAAKLQEAWADHHTSA